MEDRYHEGAQDGYVDGYNQALQDVIEVIAADFPDPNPLASLFEVYLGNQIIDAINNMKG